MRNHSLSWFLAVFVALGATQAVPLSITQQDPETCAAVLVIKARRKRRLRLKHATQESSNQTKQSFDRFNSPSFVRDAWTGPFLRAPPLSPAV
jgi:hypothetical protein